MALGADYGKEVTSDKLILHQSGGRARLNYNPLLLAFPDQQSAFADTTGYGVFSSNGTISNVKDLEQPVEPREVSLSSYTPADTRYYQCWFSM